MISNSAPKPSTSSNQPQPGVWIQYKQGRARTLQTATQDERQSGPSRLNILHEFRADLHALFLDFPGVLTDNVNIVWGTGQVRATYGVHGREFCEMVKFMVKRASTQFADIIQERSISRIHYVEDGVQLATVNLPDALPSLWSSYGLPQLPDGSSIARSMDTQSSGQHIAISNRKRRRLTSDSGVTPNEAAPSRSVVTHPERTTQVTTVPASALHLDRNSPSQATVPPLQARPKPHFQPPLRLPDIHLTREGVNGGHGLPQRPHNGPGPSSSVNLPLVPPRMPSQTPVQLSIPQKPSVAPKATDPRLRLAASRLVTRSAPAPNLTAGACARLRDPADNSILASHPIVRILVLRGTHGSQARGTSAAREAYVTDGSGYTWIALSSGPSAGNVDREDVQVGATAMLAEISRLSPSAFCAVLVQELVIVARPVDASSRLGANSSAHESRNAPSATLNDDTSAAAGALQQERAARLLAESRLQEERRRRIFVEKLLADVCRDLDNKDSVVPAAMEALMKLAELTDAAMLAD